MATLSEQSVEPTLTNEELQPKLAHLKASATRQYSLKNYNAAAEFYSEAAEVQDAIHGEMSPDNADLLYQYGRCLYHVGVSNSDVLGGRVAGGEEPKKKKRKMAKEKAEGSAAGAASAGNGLVSDALQDGEEKLTGEVVEAVVGEKEATKPASSGANPFFQITGDENWTDSEDEEDDGEYAEGDGEEEEEDDDFAIAYEILDVARVLLRRKIDSLHHDSESSQEAPEVRQFKERLADTYDLQAEIKLENEQFSDAVTDIKDSLALKLELYPQESGIVAEAHYKLSIALDFAAQNPTPVAADEEANKPSNTKPDETMRAEALSEMEKAIASCNLRVEKNLAAISSLPATKQEVAKRSIADIKAMIGEMKNRLVDLKAPVAMPEPMAGGDAMAGVLGVLLGESKDEQMKRISAVTASANDLSGMVKRKKPKALPAEPTAYEGKGKRKAEDGDAGEGNGKKVKFDDAA